MIGDKMKTEYNNDYSMSAYIIETDSVVRYHECVEIDWFQKHPEDKELFDNNKILLGTGYIYNHNYLGELIANFGLYFIYKNK